MLTDITGKILPRGWMLEHLLRDKRGITGNLQHLCPDAASGIFEDKKVKDEIDGRYVDALRDISLQFRGSSNQRLIDLNATRRTGRLTLLPAREGRRPAAQP